MSGLHFSLRDTDRGIEDMNIDLFILTWRHLCAEITRESRQHHAWYVRGLEYEAYLE